MPSNYYQQPYPYQQQPTILGCMVSSREEATGVPVDFNGRPMVFPDLGHERVFVKIFNPNTGSSVINEYRLVPEAPPVAYATASEVAELRAILQRLISKEGPTNEF